jgi:hypothetical protein
VTAVGNYQDVSFWIELQQKLGQFIIDQPVGRAIFLHEAQGFVHAIIFVTVSVFNLGAMSSIEENEQVLWTKALSSLYHPFHDCTLLRVGPLCVEVLDSVEVCTISRATFAQCCESLAIFGTCKLTTASLIHALGVLVVEGHDQHLHSARNLCEMATIASNFFILVPVHYVFLATRVAHRKIN